MSNLDGGVFTPNAFKMIKVVGEEENYGMYLLRTGKNKYNHRKSKHRAKAWC